MPAKALLALVIAFALALATGGLYAFGMAYYAVDYSWFDGSGEYVLEDAGQMEAFANLVNGTADFDGDGEPDVQHDFEGETVTLGHDIHFTARSIYYAYTLTPVGTAEHPFQGTFDGGKRAINRLLLTNTDADEANAPTSYVGLFGHVGENGRVQNVNLKDTCAIRLKVTDTDTPIQYVGAVAGWCEGSIASCMAATDIQVMWDDGNAGGGRTGENATVIDGVGGIAGYCDGDLTDSAFKGHLEVTTPADAYHIVQDDTHMVNAVKYIGGVVGRSGGDPARAGVASRSYGRVTNCQNTANLNIVTSGAGGRDRFDEVVDSKSQYVGGIAGYAIADVSGCKNTGNVAATSYVIDYSKTDEENEGGLDQADGGGDNVGGIVGGFRSEGYSTIWPTEADEVRAKASFRDGGVGVDRGIAGMREAGVHQISIVGCTNLGQVEACSNVGGITGVAGSFTNITSCINGDPKKALADTSYAKVFSTRWNKPRTGGIAGASYGRISYCRNHGQVANTKIGYYVGGIVGDLYYRKDDNGSKYDTPELWACYNTGICESGFLRRGTIAGGSGGYIHDCLFLYGLTGGEDDEERTAQVAVGYVAPGDVAVSKNLRVAYASDVAAAGAADAGDAGAFSLKSSAAVAWLNASAQKEGWEHYWMLASGVNRGYPVLKEEDFDAVAEMDLTTMTPQATLVRNAIYTAGMNPVPQVKVTVAVDGRQAELVQDADFYAVPDPDALDARGACKGVTTGKPYTARVQGIGNYKGLCCEIAYGIDKGDFAECSIYVPETRYNGGAQSPQEVLVFDAGGRVIDEGDYTYSVNGGQDCIDPGSYAVTATAVSGGNYRGSCTGKFVISKIDIAQDCDVIGVTYTEPKKPGQVEASTPRVWFYDDNVYKLYEVDPVLEGGKLTYYTLDELKGMRDAAGWWGITDELLEAYVGYPKVEGFEIQMWYNATGARPLTSATPKERDADGLPVYGMSADYIATDIKPKVIGVNYELGQLGDWWRVIYGGGSSGSVYSVNDLASEGTRNVESSAKGSITVAYGSASGSNSFTKNYDVLTFGINQVEVAPADLEITQTTTVVKYNGGLVPEDLPTVKMKYLGNVVDASNYSFEFDHVIDVNGNEHSAKSATYEIGDALYYRLHFHDSASIKCDDIDIHVTVIEDQKPIDDSSIAVEFDPDWNNVYTFAGITNPGLKVIDEDTGLTLREGIDYELQYYGFSQRASLVPAPEKVRLDNTPGVSIRGMDGYTGYRTEFYTIEKTTLDAATVEAIGKGEVEGVALRNRNTYLNVTIPESGPYFMYRVQGYDKEYLSQNLGLAWQLAEGANATATRKVEADTFSNGNSVDGEHLFEVERIRDARGDDVTRAVEPGAYTITVTGTVEGDLGFQFPVGEHADVPLYIAPIQLSGSTFTGFDGNQHKIPNNNVSVWNLTHGKDPSWALGDADLVPYSGNPVQPHALVTDGYFNTHKDALMKDAKDGGAEWKKHVLPRSDYRVVTVGFENSAGPVEPGSYYVSRVVASGSSGHIEGSYAFPGNNEVGSIREYRVIAADLSDLEVADIDSDLSEGAWIKVGEAFYGDEGARPEVTFWIDGEQCSYVEGEDYWLDYRDNTQVGTGTVRITALDEGHLTATERDDEARPYVEVPFEILGDAVNLADTEAVSWTLPDELALADAETGALVSVPATATYVNSLGRTVTVPEDAYELACGTFDESAGVFAAKSEGWQAGETVWFQVTSTGKYPQFTAVSTAAAGAMSPSAAGSDGLMAVPLSVLVGHTVVGHAAVTAGSSLSTANQDGEPITAVLATDVLQYTGSEDMPAVTVKDDEVALVEGRDYVLERSEGADAGPASVTVHGIGSYTGTCVLPFTVLPAAVSSCDVSVDPMTYTGSVLRPPTDSISVKIGDVELPASDWKVQGYAETSVDAGDGAGSLVLEAASENLTGSAEVTFDIKGAPLGPPRFAVSVADQDFTGSNVAVSADDVHVTDTVLKRDLSWGEDFAVGYAGDHRSVGQASLVVSGRGNYAGSMTATFNIVGSDLSGAKVETIGGTGTNGAFVYTGSAIKPELRVTLNGQELEEGDDFKATFANNVNKGTANITVTGQGNTTGKASATFAIEASDVSRCTVYQKTSEYSYTGAGVEPAVVLRLNGNRVPASQYRLHYVGEDGSWTDEAPVEIGSYETVIEGRGDNLSGTAFAAFDIVQAPVGECRIALTGAWYDFGAPVKPAVSVATSAGVAIDEDEFTVAYYGSGVELGAKSWVNVEATGQHIMGTTFVQFTIGRIPISAEDVKFDGGGVYEYTGGEIRPVPSIVIGERVLKRGTDFDVNYLGDCVSVGTQPVEITCPATSVFTSDATARFTIVEPEEEGDSNPAKPTTPAGSAGSSGATGSGASATPTTPAAPSSSAPSAPSGAPAASTTPGASAAPKTPSASSASAAPKASTAPAKKLAQTVTVASKVSKRFGAKAFKLGAKTNGDGALSYASSSKKVATVSNSGVVTIKGAGKATITVKCSAGKRYVAAASRTVALTVAKAAQPLKASGKTATVSAKALAKKARSLARSKLISVSKAKGKVTFKKKSGNAKIKVNAKTGKLTVKKGLKRGTYKLKVKVTAVGTANYKPATKTITCKIRVK